jgi:hypothetical protein
MAAAHDASAGTAGRDLAAPGRVFVALGMGLSCLGLGRAMLATPRPADCHHVTT